MSSASGKVAIIIQARMGSTRLPGKSLILIEGKPIIWHVVERAKHSKQADSILLATTTEKSDDELEKFCNAASIPCFRGNLEDVLDRYYNAAKSCSAGIIVRITGDSPLVDPALIDKAVMLLKKGKLDYAANTEQPWMDGFDVEAFTFSALERAWKEAAMSSEREHVTLHIRNSPLFKKEFIKNDPRLEHVQCSIDRVNDLKFVSEVYKLLLKKGLDHKFSYKDVIALLEENPQLLKINSESIVNEGMYKSIREDRKVK